MEPISQFQFLSEVPPFPIDCPYIEETENAIKPEKNEENLKYLRNKEEQLRKEKEQLRKEKEQLRKEKANLTTQKGNTFK